MFLVHAHVGRNYIQTIVLGWDEMPAWQTRVILIADGSIFMRAPVFQILAILIIWASLSPDSTALIRISKMQK
jgi:hypothetical protein